MREELKTRISKYMSYLLRHNPEDLKMDGQGFVNLNELLHKIRERFPQADMKLIREIVERSERRRFEIRNGKIRALYGHSIPVKMELREADKVKVLYHGTTPEAAEKILRTGLKPMKRRWVHLSPTREIAERIGLRRTKTPVILEIDAEKARKNGMKFYKATEEVYLSEYIPPKYIKRITRKNARKTDNVREFK